MFPASAAHQRHESLQKLFLFPFSSSSSFTNLFHHRRLLPIRSPLTPSTSSPSQPFIVYFDAPLVRVSFFLTADCSFSALLLSVLICSPAISNPSQSSHHLLFVCTFGPKGFPSVCVYLVAYAHINRRIKT